MVKTILCADWDDFREAVRLIRNPGDVPRCLFRGHREESWKLSSQWERMARSALGEDSDEETARVLREHRDKYLERFREALVASPDFSLSEFRESRELWAFGRHFGLITPFLDWTESPYIAAYFAAADFVSHYNPGQAENFLEGSGYAIPEEEWGKPIVIYQLVCNKRLFADREFAIFRPQLDRFHRMRAQASWFSELTANACFSVEEWLTHRNFDSCIFKYLIPSLFVFQILADLKLMNISAKTLFPDPFGAVQYANVDYKNWIPYFVWNDSHRQRELLLARYGEEWLEKVESRHEWIAIARNNANVQVEDTPD